MSSAHAPAQSPAVRLALVGLDHWYAAIPLAQDVAARPGIELVGIADPDQARATEVAGKAGGVKATTNAEEFLDDPTVDVIASFTSVERNPEICLAAAETGKHLLSIKPFARTLDEAATVVEAVRRTGVAFLPAESQNRAAPQSERLKTWLAEGFIGRPLTASFSLWTSLPRGWHDSTEPGWFTDPDRAPGGGWIDHAIYHIDLLRWLFGSEVTSVTGTTASLKYPDLALEDYGLAVLRFDNGVVARIEDTWTTPPGGGRQEMSIVGTEGAVAYDSLSGRVSLTGPKQPYDGWVHVAPQPQWAGAVDRLIATVRGEQDPLATVEDAWHNLATCRAFYEAAASGLTTTPASLP